MNSRRRVNAASQDSGGKVVFAKTGKELPTRVPDLIRLLREGTAERTAQPNQIVGRERRQHVSLDAF